MKKGNVCLFKILKQYLRTVLPPKTFTWGDLLSIPTSNYYSIFLLNSVNHDEGSMPVKNNSHLMNKLHPNKQCNAMFSFCLLGTSLLLLVSLLSKIKVFNNSWCVCIWRKKGGGGGGKGSGKIPRGNAFLLDKHLYMVGARVMLDDA